MSGWRRECEKQIAEAMGEVAGETIPQRVIVRCNGTFENAPKNTIMTLSLHVLMLICWERVKVLVLMAA